MRIEEKHSLVDSSGTIRSEDDMSESMYSSELVDAELDNLKAKIENDKIQLDYIERALKDFEMSLQKFKAVQDMGKYLFDIVKKAEEVLSKKLNRS